MDFKKRVNWVPVVTGLIVKQNQVLVGCRPDNKNLAGKWEFPGGKIEIGESPEAALSRELKEELGIEAKVGSLLLADSHKYGDTGILLLFYMVKFWNGEPKSKHHTEIKWVDFDSLKDLDQPAANTKLLPQILSFLTKE
jgi:8-oxo-dGTP diphosphatase